MKRAMASCVLNLAEGNSRKSRIERRRFFEVSRASAAEVSACLDLARTFELMSKEKVTGYKSSIEDISKMLWALMR
jgi:four helix bundle protein